MHHEIERKFLVKETPSLSGLEKVSQERYFLQRGDLIEEAYRRKDSVYYYEKKVSVSPVEKTREKTIVTEEEYERMKSNGTPVIVRDSYLLTEEDERPIISIKVYKGAYYGLVLAEVEFDSVEERENYDPEDWMGTDITELPFGKDSTLVDLDVDQFNSELNHLLENLSASGSQM